MTSNRLFYNFAKSYCQRVPVQKNSTPLMKKVCDEFYNYVPKVIEKGVAEATFIGTPQLRDRIQRVANYYMNPRYPAQGEFMAFAYDYLEEREKISDEKLNQLFVLVTAVELVQTYFFFTDDMEDDAEHRCDKTCWHVLPDVGPLTLVDVCLLRSFVDELIRQNFKGELRDHILNVFTKNDVIDAVVPLEGKTATDIHKATCTWVAVTLLQKCNAQQRRIFEECYGTSDPEKVTRIKQLYKEIDIVSLYRQEEQTRYDAYFQKVDELPANAVPSAGFFRSFANLMRSFTDDVTKFMY